MDDMPERLKIARLWHDEQVAGFCDRIRKLRSAYQGPSQMAELASIHADALDAARIAFELTWQNAGLLAEQANWWKRVDETKKAEGKVHVLKRGLALCNGHRPGLWPVDDRWVAYYDTELLGSVTCSGCRDGLGRQF